MQGYGQLGVERRGGLSVTEVGSTASSAAVGLLQARGPDGVRLTGGSTHGRPVPGTVRRATMELLVHSARAEIPTRPDSRYERVY